ncbi:MAG TPA: DUF177 domain-containing protein [Chloroflexota bacterium]|jgi:uncharacterized protein|nr:DUF177 domain-containing protein [Chloroflexota bacterium]
MVINVAQLLKAPVGTTREYEIDERIPTLDDRIELTRSVTGTVRLLKTNRSIVVKARLTTSVRLECSRCLDVFVADLPIRFEEEYIPTVDIVTGLAAHVPHESYAYLINEKHELDLEPAIREYGILALPMKPLCSTECGGLCPQCGTNLNQQKCTCIVEPVDHRFAVLRALLASEEEHGE